MSMTKDLLENIQKNITESEDLDKCINDYAQYVDTFELVTDKERQHVLFKIYKQEKWSGRISDIIPSFHGDLESRYVLDTFGAVRAGCGKRCMYKPGSCNICDRFIDTAAVLKENKIIVNRPKKR